MLHFRAHDLRITFRCTTDEISTEIKQNIEAIVNSCTRNKYAIYL